MSLGSLAGFALRQVSGWVSSQDVHIPKLSEGSWEAMCAFRYPVLIPSSLLRKVPPKHQPFSLAFAARKGVAMAVSVGKAAQQPGLNQ